MVREINKFTDTTGSITANSLTKILGRINSVIRTKKILCTVKAWMDINSKSPTDMLLRWCNRYRCVDEQDFSDRFDFELGNIMGD